MVYYKWVEKYLKNKKGRTDVRKGGNYEKRMY